MDTKLLVLSKSNVSRLITSHQNVIWLALTLYCRKSVAVNVEGLVDSGLHRGIHFKFRLISRLKTTARDSGLPTLNQSIQRFAQVYPTLNATCAISTGGHH